MKKILILINLFVTIIFADTCIGNNYEPTIIDGKDRPTVEITAPVELPNSGAIDLQANVTMDSSATPYYQWCTNIGTLQKNNDEFSSIKWILPSNWGEQVYRAKIYLVAGDMFGYEAYAQKSFAPSEGNVNLDPTQPSTQLNVQYIDTEDKFKVSWQSKNTDNLEILYSWDNVTFERFAMLSVKNQATGSHTASVDDSKEYKRIYFKPVSYKGLEKFIGSVNVWSYEPKTDNGGSKSSEIPEQVVMRSMGDRTIHNHVTPSWRMVKDSHGEDNVVYYELMYADNYRFDNAQTIDAGNNLSYKVENLQDDEKYYFKVRAVNHKGEGDWSDYESIQIDLENLPEFDTSTQTPSNQATGVSKTPTFRWEASDKDGDDLEYYVSIGESSDNLNYTSGWIEGTKRFNYSDEFSRPLKPNTTYYWQVTYREDGHYKDYYGGEYPKSPIWSFTTVGTGPDLAITSIKRISDVEVNEWISFEVTIKNNGSEVADDEDVIPYFVKDGKENDFAAYKRGSMQQQLAPGEEETVIVKLEFSNKIEERTFTRFNLDGTEYEETVSYDNILVDGENTVLFKFRYDRFDVDTNSANDSMTDTISYSLADNLPEIKEFRLLQNNLSKSKGDYRYILGWKVMFSLDVEDNLNIEKVELEYRTSEDSPWQELKTYNNINDTDFNLYTSGDDGTPWVLPIDDKSLVTQSMQLRVKAYNSPTTFSTKTTNTFKVFDNTISVDELNVDKSSYKTGEPIFVTYSVSHESQINTAYIYIKQGDSKERLLKYKREEGGTFYSSDTLQFTVPNEADLIGNEAVIEIYIQDEIGAYKRIDSSKFTIEQDTSVPKVFSEYQDILAQEYSSFPDNTLRHSTKNYVKKTIIDDDGLVHLLVLHHGEWWTANRYGRIDELKDHAVYYYMTYNPMSKQISTPRKIFESKRIDSGNLADESYRDFIMNGNTPILLTVNYKDHIATQYQLNGSSVEKTVLVTGEEFDSYALVNYNGKTYLSYRYLASIVEDRRAKAMEIYPNKGVSENIVDEYYGSSFRVNNNLLSFFYKGITFELGSSLKVIDSSKYEFAGLENKLRGDIKIYDSNIKEMYADSEDNLFLVTKDNTIEPLFNLDDSTLSENVNGYTQRIEAAVYEDSVIVIYSTIEERKYKVVFYNRNSQKKESTVLGNKVSSTDDIFNWIAINDKKQIVIGNPDSQYDASAQLVTADLGSGFGATVPSINIDTEIDTIEVNKAINISWSLEKESADLDHFKVYKIVNGTSTLLTTINDISNRQYSYTQINANENIVSLRVEVVNSEGGSSFDQIALRVVGEVTFDSFTVDKHAISLGEALLFSWQTTGETSNNLYKGYKKCSTESAWSEIFTTKSNSKSYMVSDFSGSCQFKIVSGNSERVLADNVEIDGTIYEFKDNSFSPNGDYNMSAGVVNFKWSTWFEDNVEFNLYVKKSEEANFEKVASTMNREYSYSGDVGSTFKWKVSFEYAGETVTSPIMDVVVNKIDKPSILNADFTLNNGILSVTLEISSLSNATKYDIYRNQYNGSFNKIGTTENTTYRDEDISYGESYGYYVVAVKEDIYSLASDEVNLDAGLDEAYEVVMETENYQQLTTNEIILKYKPNKTVSLKSMKCYMVQILIV